MTSPLSGYGTPYTAECNAAAAARAYNPHGARVVQVQMPRGQQLPAPRAPSAPSADAMQRMLDAVDSLKTKISQQKPITYADVQQLQTLAPEVREGLRQQVTGLNLSTSWKGPHLTDAEFENLLTQFPNVQTLNLSGQDKLTMEGLESTRRLTNLQTLNLANCSVSDNDLLQLLSTSSSGMSDDEDFSIPFAKLETLSLAGCRITRASVDTLAGKVLHLKHLNVSHCHAIDHQGIAALGKLTNLQTLDLSDCRMSSYLPVVSALQQLPQLQSLNVALDWGLPHRPEFGRELVARGFKATTVHCDQFQKV